jgi:hypothetical protein
VLRITDRPAAFAIVALLGLLPWPGAAPDGAAVEGAPTEVTQTDNVTHLARFPGVGGSEVDSDGQRYLFAGQANLTDDLARQNVEEGQHGGLRIVDLDTLEVVGELDCPGTDNYVRYLDPAVYNTPAGDREYVAMAHHGNLCTRELLADDPNTRPGYGASNGVMIVDVTDKTAPEVVSAIGHDSAHTVMPHPTRPYLYVLPGGLANGTNVPNQRVSPTGIIDVSDPTAPVYAASFTHNAQGCHDLGFTHDGEHAFCAGLGEVQVWDIAGDRIEAPQVVGTIVNPAIQFAHNAVVSPSGRYLAINDEAFGFHTCSGEAADLYGSLWIYDISVPELPVLAGRISPPGHPSDQGFGTLDDVGPVDGWADSWCAAHNYNWVPGNDDVIVASWFGGGTTAHDLSDLLAPQLLALYQPHDGVAWSGHYYAGYLVTNDMVRGLEVLEVPELRAADPTWQDRDGEDDARPGRRPDHAGRPEQPGRPAEPGRPGGPSDRRQAVPEAAAPTPRGTAGGADLASGVDLAVVGASAPRIDRTAQLLPEVLPPRPSVPRDPWSSGICVLPGRVLG